MSSAPCWDIASWGALSEGGTAGSPLRTLMLALRRVPTRCAMPTSNTAAPRTPATTCFHEDVGLELDVPFGCDVVLSLVLVGAVVGEQVGAPVEALVGVDVVGLLVGTYEGDVVGEEDGEVVGLDVVGLAAGFDEGDNVSKLMEQWVVS